MRLLLNGVLHVELPDESSPQSSLPFLYMFRLLSSFSFARASAFFLASFRFFLCSEVIRTSSLQIGQFVVLVFKHECLPRSHRSTHFLWKIRGGVAAMSKLYPIPTKFCISHVSWKWSYFPHRRHELRRSYFEEAGSAASRKLKEFVGRAWMRKEGKTERKKKK